MAPSKRLKLPGNFVGTVAALLHTPPQPKKKPKKNPKKKQARKSIRAKV